MEGPSHLLRDARGGGELPVWSYEHSASSPSFQPRKGFIHFVPPKGWRSHPEGAGIGAGSPGGRSPVPRQRGVCDSGRLAQPCEVVRAQLAKGGWSPRPQEAWRVGVPVVLRLHLADSAGGDAFSLSPSSRPRRRGFLMNLYSCHSFFL